MELNTFLISMVSMGGLGLLFAAGLSIANKKLYVEEDPRITEVTEALPGANCGGCGYPGCANFAENVVLGRADINGCPVSSADAVARIAAIMGVEVTAGEKQIARVMCQGGIEETAKKADYVGIQSCIAATFAGGGDKLCRYGCLGFGDCVRACPFDAMYMDKNGLPVVIEEKCTGCGKCVEACPRGIMELHPISHKLFVFCKNQDDPKTSRTICTRACIACQICVRAVNEGEMYMKDNLALVDYEKFGKDDELPTEKCPTNCLKIMDHQKRIEEQSTFLTKVKLEV